MSDPVDAELELLLRRVQCVQGTMFPAASTLVPEEGEKFLQLRETAEERLQNLRVTVSVIQNIERGQQGVGGAKEKVGAQSQLRQEMIELDRVLREMDQLHQAEVRKKKVRNSPLNMCENLLKPIKCC